MNCFKVGCPNNWRVKYLSRIVIAFVAILMMPSCSDDDGGPELPPPPDPVVDNDDLGDLLQAYNDGKIFSSAVSMTDGCVINFADGENLTISKSEFEIVNCTTSEPLSVSSQNGQWWVGGVSTGIKFNANVADEDATPVYVYYDKQTLYVYLSNSTNFRFWSVELQKYWPSEAELKRHQNIPVIRLTAQGPIVDKDNYVDGTITVLDPEKLYSEVTEFSADMGIRGRGNSTWSWPKKPWKVKLDSKASILGMPADKEWALLANYSDRTLLRNIVAMKLSEMCGFSWTPRIRSVEVYLNNEYQGVYTICEHKKISSSRVNIDVVEEDVSAGEALEGGYYLEVEEAQDAEVCWWTQMGVPMMFSDPEEPNAAQEAYVKNYISEFETVLQGSKFADPETGYAAYLDLKSFIDFYIVQELTKNVDGNMRKSTFITKERGKKMEMYHLWDFDLTMGNCGYFNGTVGNGPENFWVKDYDSHSNYGGGWYRRLFQDPAFVDKVQARWNELKPQLETIPDFIEAQAMALDPAQKHNFQRWSINESVDWVRFPSLGSYEAEVEYLKSFYKERLKWLDRELNKL